MKGISTIIATILILLIVVALGGMTYLNISGVYTRTSQGLEVVEGSCSGTSVRLVLRNAGTETISSFTCLQTAPAGDTGTPCTNTVSTQSITIQPGTTVNFDDTCLGSGTRDCIYRITPPTGRSITASVTCV
ncbi:MAG: hypothetical protein QXO57_02040 [Candidatus Aenigmatarchaeota archaeon]